MTIPSPTPRYIGDQVDTSNPVKLSINGEIKIAGYIDDNLRVYQFAGKRNSLIRYTANAFNPEIKVWELIKNRVDYLEAFILDEKVSYRIHISTAIAEGYRKNYGRGLTWTIPVDKWEGPFSPGQQLS